jgi:hypothetical protein
VGRAVGLAGGTPSLSPEDALVMLERISTLPAPSTRG